MSDANVTWVATLSDGSTAVEHVGEYQIVPGERKPWVRLTQFASKNGLHLTSLRVNFRGRTIHMPRANFDRFAMGEKSRAPLFYSLAYLAEGTMGAAGESSFVQEDFIELVAHYSSFEVHYIQSLGKSDNSWIVVTEEYQPLAPSPAS